MKFAVKNFEKFQHYKDRAPPWIKLYNELLDDYEFAHLQDASKMHLISIWLLASRTGNEIPYDAQWIAAKISATNKVDLAALEKAGFIYKINMVQNASGTLADCTQDACLETEGETEERQSREARAMRLPTNWEPDSDLVSWFRTERPDLNLAATVDGFRDYWHAQPGANARKLDWRKTFKNWSRNQRAINRTPIPPPRIAVNQPG